VKYLRPNFFKLQGFPHKRNFGTTSVPVCTVNAESFSEFAIHNFEKVEKSKFTFSPMEGNW